MGEIMRCLQGDAQEAQVVRIGCVSVRLEMVESGASRPKPHADRQSKKCG